MIYDGTSGTNIILRVTSRKRSTDGILCLIITSNYKTRKEHGRRENKNFTFPNRANAMGPAKSRRTFSSSREGKVTNLCSLSPEAEESICPRAPCMAHYCGPYRSIGKTPRSRVLSQLKATTFSCATLPRTKHGHKQKKTTNSNRKKRLPREVRMTPIPQNGDQKPLTLSFPHSNPQQDHAGHLRRSCRSRRSKNTHAHPTHRPPVSHPVDCTGNQDHSQRRGGISRAQTRRLQHHGSYRSRSPEDSHSGVQ